MMWWHHGGWGAGDWLAMSFMMVLFWGLLIALIGWLVNSSRGPTAPSTSGRTSVSELLAERLARGEFDEAEFNRRRALLHMS